MQKFYRDLHVITREHRCLTCLAGLGQPSKVYTLHAAISMETFLGGGARVPAGRPRWCWLAAFLGVPGQSVKLPTPPAPFPHVSWETAIPKTPGRRPGPPVAAANSPHCLDSSQATSTGWLLHLTSPRPPEPQPHSPGPYFWGQPLKSLEESYHSSWLLSQSPPPIPPSQTFGRRPGPVVTAAKSLGEIKALPWLFSEYIYCLVPHLPGIPPNLRPQAVGWDSGESLVVVQKQSPPCLGS